MTQQQPSHIESRPSSPTLWALLAGAFLSVCILALGPALFAQNNDGASGQSKGEDTYLGTIQILNQFIRENYVDTVEMEKLYEGALKGMFEALGDPYSIYMDSEEMDRLSDTTTGEFAGVGMYVDKQRSAEGKLIPGGFVEVVSPIEGTPADLAGLQAGDLIVEINGESTTEMTIDEAVNKIRGPNNSTVDFRIFRGSTMDFKKTIVRKTIQIPTVRSAMIDQVGYVRITSFTPLTREQMEQTLSTFMQKSMKALIIDLRNNPGGVLDGAVDVADMFYDEGVIVSTKGRVEFENKVYHARKGKIVPLDMPVICLLNEGSASASEILGGALRDRNRALMLGSKSYGKASVQTVRGLGSSGFKLTIARYFTPADIGIDKIGIPPDVAVAEPALTKEEEVSYLKFVDGDHIKALVDTFGEGYRKKMNEIQGVLAKDGIVLPQRLVMRFIQRELDRRNNITREYDLEYDIVLQKALEIIKEGSVGKRIQERPVATASTAGTGLPAPMAK